MWRSPRLGGREPAASWGLHPRRLLRPFGPSPAPSALPPGIPQGFRFAAPLALRAHPPIVPPGGGRMAPRWCSTTLARNKPHWCTTAARSSRKPCNGRALNKRRGAATLSHPPAPSRWEGERVALCRQGCRAYGLRPSFLHPMTEREAFQGHQGPGFALKSSPVRCSPCGLRSACGFRFHP